MSWASVGEGGRISGVCSGLGAARRGGRLSQGGAAGDHLGDVVLGEFGENVAAPLLAAHEQPNDECAVLLEEEHVTRILFVHVAPEDPEGPLVVTGFLLRL